MRLWSIHPKYLDAVGLVALWREALLAAEWEHLLGKLRQRQPARYRQLVRLARPEVHPLFRIVPGAVRAWERSTETR